MITAQSEGLVGDTGYKTHFYPTTVYLFWLTPAISLLCKLYSTHFIVCTSVIILDWSYLYVQRGLIIKLILKK